MEHLVMFFGRHELLPGTRVGTQVITTEEALVQESVILELSLRLNDCLVLVN
jgi:hypothetical protein